VSGGRRRLPAVAAAALVFGSIVVFSRLSLADEAWFLHVVSRVASGDVLYRDVFFGATPLSVYAALAPVAAFGADVAWIKLEVVLCFVCSVLIAVRIGRQLGLIDRLGSLALLVLALMVWAPPVVGSVYQPLATVCLLACFSLVLDWIDRAGPSLSRAELGALVLAAAAAALAFASKHNVGLLAFAALLGSVALAGPPSPLRAPAGRAAVSAGVFAVLSAALLVPVALSGATAALVKDGLTGKGDYLHVAGTLYLDEFVALASLLKPGGKSDVTHDPGLFYWRVPFLLVPLLLVALPIAWSKGGPTERRRTVVVALFALAAAVAVFPGTVTHLRFVAAALVLAAGYVASRVATRDKPRRVAAAKVALAIWLVPGVVVLAVVPAYRIATGERRLSELPRFRGAFAPPARQRRLLRNSRELRRADHDGRLFLLTPDASFYYSSAGLRDPTPFGMSQSTIFGRTGQAETIGRIERGELRVCARFDRSSKLNPEELERFVESRLRPARALGACTLYR